MSEGFGDLRSNFKEDSMYIISLKKLSGHDKSAKVGKIAAIVGQTIQAGEILFNAESGKGNFKVVSEFGGIVEKVLIDEGQMVKLGDPVIQMAGDQPSQSGQSGGAEPQTGTKSGYSFGISKPKKETIECEIVVIGGGPGGYVAAIRAAQLGATVVLIEKERLGGTCLNHGCIPTKSLVKSAHFFEEVTRASDFGISIQSATPDMSRIIERKNEVVDTLVGGIENLMAHWGIRYIVGEATIEGSQCMVQNKKVDATIHAKHTILATGASPVRLRIPGANLERVITSQEALQLKEIPNAMTIIGGGIIGMEFAFIFNALGCRVTVVEFMDRILSTLDEDLAENIVTTCEARGITLYTGAKAERIMEAGKEGLITEFSIGGELNYVVGDYVLMAVGRRPNLESLPFSDMGVELSEFGKGIKVNSQMQTTNPDYYAIGDLTNIIQLAHVASHQGVVAAEAIMGRSSKMSYEAIPSVVFVTPEIGMVGDSEMGLIKAGKEYQVGRFPFCANGKALTAGATEGFVKVLVDPSGVIIGAGIVGIGASDLIAGFAHLIQSGVRAEALTHTVFAHPTTSEAIHEAVLSLNGGAIHFA